MFKPEEGALLAPNVQLLKREKSSKNVLLTFFVVTNFFLFD